MAHLVISDWFAIFPEKIAWNKKMTQIHLITVNQKRMTDLEKVTTNWERAIGKSQGHKRIDNWAKGGGGNVYICMFYTFENNVFF